jgi:hypothetical protein
MRIAEITFRNLEFHFSSIGLINYYPQLQWALQGKLARPMPEFAVYRHLAPKRRPHYDMQISPGLQSNRHRIAPQKEPASLHDIRAVQLANGMEWREDRIIIARKRLVSGNLLVPIICDIDACAKYCALGRSGWKRDGGIVGRPIGLPQL